MKNLSLLLILSLSFSSLLGQEIEDTKLNTLNLSLNINAINKLRSYGVSDSEGKYEKSPVFVGFDAAIFYETKYHQIGVEIYPYLHTNLSYGIDLFNYYDKDYEIKLIPEIKYGYSWILEKQYVGIGVKAQYRYLNLKVYRMLHVKSGESNYWGDGITGVSLGFNLKKSTSVIKKGIKDSYQPWKN